MKVHGNLKANLDYITDVFTVFLWLTRNKQRKRGGGCFSTRGVSVGVPDCAGALFELTVVTISNYKYFTLCAATTI